MAVKGKQKEVKDSVRELFVGFTPVKVVAVNPTRDEINKLFGKEGTPEDKDITYLGNDQEGNDRLRLAFYLKDTNDRYFIHSFNITNKPRLNLGKDKVQIINSIGTTSWAPFIKDSSGELTDKVDESVIQNWFINFTDKEGKVLGQKKWRKALSGEEELGTLLRSWLGRLNFNDPETEVLVDAKKLFKGDIKELKQLISLTTEGDFSLEGYDTPFVVLTGVETDSDDSTKKYQKVWSKSFLPNSFMKYINNGNRFPTDYAKKIWKKFKEEVEGDYGFNGYTELVAITEYDASKDVVGSGKTGKEVPQPHTSDY